MRTVQEKAFEKANAFTNAIYLHIFHDSFTEVSGQALLSTGMKITQGK